MTKVWIVGSAGGGKTALQTRLRGYTASRDSSVVEDETRAAQPPRPSSGGEFTFSLSPSEGAPAAGRVVYVDRAAHHHPALVPTGADVWLVPEGEEALGGDFEAAYLRDQLREVGGTLTLLPQLLAAAASGPAPTDSLAERIDRRLRWGLRYLELRDDLLDDRQLLAAAALVPPAQRLVSIRRQRPPTGAATAWEALRQAAESAALWDWPLELGPRPELGLRTPWLASLHTRHPGESLDDAIRRLSAAGATAELLKLAIPIHNLAELLAGHAWVRRDPARHQFLPSCGAGSGRWAWYRLWRGKSQHLNFLRETAAAGTAPSPDQPLLYEWLVRHAAAGAKADGPPFAALLGDPVAHSRTPAEQRLYFESRGWPVFLIAITEADLQSCEPLQVLAELGLRAAAVTAPRKHDGRRWLADSGGTFVPSAAGDPTDVCNTLGRAPDGRFFGTNTDGIGLRAGWQTLCAQDATLVKARVALWGGGGTAALLRTAFPDAIAFSARTGQPRAAVAASSDPAWSPEVVVWAVGRSRQPQCSWPSPSWQPRLIFDLNYSDDSPGREYAERCGACYESGLRFFRAQAAAQRQFWDQVLCQP